MKKGYIVLGLMILLSISVMIAVLDYNLRHKTTVEGWTEREKIINAWNLENAEIIKEIDERSISEINLIDSKSQERIAKLNLNTPLNYDVVPGKDRKVAEFSIDNYKELKTYVSQMEFYNINDGMKPISKNITFKYRVLDHIDKVAVTNVTGINKDGTYQTEVVDYIDNPIYRWQSISSFNQAPDGNITVGVFADVYQGESIEWIPTFNNVLRVPEWASWNATMETDLAAVWNMEEASGDIEDVFDGDHNGTQTNSPNYQQTGINNYAIDFDDASDDYFAIQNSNTLDNSAITINAWVLYGGQNGSGLHGIATDGNEGAGSYKMYIQNGVLHCAGRSASGTAYDAVCSTNPNGWTMLTCVFDTVADQARGFVNGTWECSNSPGNNMDNNPSTNQLTVGTLDWASSLAFEGLMDEVYFYKGVKNTSFIESLYDSGTGTFYSAGGGGGSPDTVLNISLMYPDDNFATTSNSQTFNVSVNISDGTYGNTTLFLWHPNGSVYNSYLNDSNYGSLEQINVSWQLAGLDDGIYNWSARVDYLNSTPTGESEYADSNKTITIDATDPTITINTPTSDSAVDTLPTNISLNATVVDDNLGTCWYFTSDDATNTTYTCNTLTNASFSTGGNKTINAWVNDTLGNTANSSKSFFINFINLTIDYETSVVENEPTAINFTLEASSITSINGSIFYNDVELATDITSNSTQALFNTSTTAPDFSIAASVPIYLNYSLNGVNYTSSTYTQTIIDLTPLSITTSCGALDEALRFDFKDEQNQTEVNATVAYNILFGVSNSTENRVYGSLTNIQTFYICINATASTNYSIGYGEFDYLADSYVERRYYLFEDQIISNNTLSNHTLYSLLSSEQTSFKLEVEDTSLNPYIEKYTALLRWYPALNEYRVVEMGLTDEKGDTVIHVQAEDVDYRIAVYERNGSIIKLEDPTRMICLVNPCTYTLKISPTDEDFTSFFDIDYDFDYNTTTGVWSFQYSDSSQLTSLMNLTVYKVTGVETYSICEDYSTGYTGVLTCNTSAYSGTLKGTVERSASPEVPITQMVIQTSQTAFASTWGLWLSLIIGIPIVFIFSLVSPIAAIIGGVVSLIPAFYLGSINIAILGGIAILAGIAIHFLRRIG